MSTLRLNRFQDKSVKPLHFLNLPLNQKQTLKRQAAIPNFRRAKTAFWLSIQSAVHCNSVSFACWTQNQTVLPLYRVGATVHWLTKRRSAIYCGELSTFTAGPQTAAL